MSTRCAVAYKNPSNGTIISVYSHSDGYPEYTGAKLHSLYNNELSALRIIALGNSSGSWFEADRPTYAEREGDVTEQVTHFRNEECFVNNLDNHYGAEFAYLWDEGQWFVFTAHYERADDKISVKWTKETLSECLAKIPADKLYSFEATL